MLKEELNSSLFILGFENLESIFQNPLLKDWSFVHPGSCERGIFARLVSLDSARGVLALPSVSAVLADWLFYCAGFGFCPFFHQVWPSRFIVFAPF